MMFSPSAAESSSRVDEDEFSVLLGRDGEFGLVDGCDAIPDHNPSPIDGHHALRGSEIAVPVPIRRVGEDGPGNQRRAHDASIGAYKQRLRGLRLPACQLDETSRPICFRKLAAVPAGRPAALTGKQPDLEELQRILIAIVLGMPDPGSGTYDLDVARYGAANIADAILMGDRALADIGDDFHVCMGVQSEAGPGRDLVVVPNHERAKRPV